ncbi:heparinase [Prauserella marina]|uniref:Heparinase II/III N-terminus n=1 Tax=Prauserella marina TaxID=530584 RepID=A0A222VJB4_9PSEU|nr:alginate lyase family protein [Prauserella marina]ASR34018.1 heparinase [Prauserella marina]PWV82643.1 heparinase II/III-like protein [Prauserella marina]SDC73713.1 Heparinase II/III N-terminus [Prauserella marina]
MTSTLWYLRRLSRMGPAEIAARAADTARRRRWRAELTAPVEPAWYPARQFTATLPENALEAVSREARDRVLASAEDLLAGRAEYFGVPRTDLVSPDWSVDPMSGLHAPRDDYAFDIPYRDESAIGNVKHIWEPSRHQHLTLLAAAYALSGDERFAERVADHLKSWWAANPPLRGVHWISGIELGIRLLSWVWTRRLLDGWRGARALFEDNEEALHQIRQHQRWLAAFRSGGSSANNHAIAESAGQLAAACAFPWFAASRRWRHEAMRDLDKHLRHNTFPSGINRELATEYHGLVLELGFAGFAEATAAGLAFPEQAKVVLLRMTDALAAILDGRLRPPRQGDADEGHGLIVDGEGTSRWDSLLGTGASVFGAMPWWPEVTGRDARTPLLAALIGDQPTTARRPGQRPAHFADAGLTILSAGEVWCRCDGGPHGFLSIAAHAHADALSVEVRKGGFDVLADPGTYCYHGEPEWRSYFRSTLGHNTLELGEEDQSVSGGPFLWTRHARSTVLVAPTEASSARRWCAEHDGYTRGGRPATHRRTVELDDDGGQLRIVDQVLGRYDQSCRLAFHLGPDVETELNGNTAILRWPDDTATMTLPSELDWSAHRGETSPPLGWYSPGFGRRTPTVTLLGDGTATPGVAMTTVLRF